MQNTVVMGPGLSNAVQRSTPFLGKANPSSLLNSFKLPARQLF
jgi:hypothetical protein